MGLCDVLRIGGECGCLSTEAIVVNPSRLVDQGLPDRRGHTATVGSEGRQRTCALLIRTESDGTHATECTTRGATFLTVSIVYTAGQRDGGQASYL